MAEYLLKSISNDPVINLYNNLVKQSHTDLTLPTFSEIFLRFALTEYIKVDDQTFPAILQVYRKLLVLHYNQLYPSMANVQKIMEPIFSYFDLINIFNGSSQILQDWQKFVQNNCQ